IAVELDRPLLAGQPHLVGVHHDHEVAGVDVARERRAVLAAQNIRDLGRGAAERLAFDVGDVPRARERLLGLVGGTVVWGCGAHKTKRGFYLSPAALSTCGASSPFAWAGVAGSARRDRKSPTAAQARNVR